MSTSSRAVCRSLLTLVLITAAAASCVDAPSEPDETTFAPPFVIAPSLALVGPDGAPVASAAQADALAAAFDLVDRFRMVVTRTATAEVVVDTVVAVTPGQDEYDLSISVEISGTEEQFTVLLTALQGTTELFKSDPVTVKATAASSASSSSPPAATNVTMAYSGPGTTATTIQIAPATLVLAPSGQGSFSAEVQDGQGNTLTDVPVAFALSSSGVVTMDEGSVTAVSEGVVQVVAATPTGLEATAWAYVVGGELAYAQGGVIQLRGAASGAPEARSSAGGAGQPAWAPDGDALYYAAGGQVHLAGGGALLDGGWPSVSPDGTKLAVDQGGTVYYANADGTHPTPGPTGATPVWADGATLLVGGGSVERVRADGTGRTSVAGGNAALPSLGPGGAVAYVADGSLFVTDRAGALLDGVLGRPSWSPNGMWLVVQATGGLTVVPSDGSAPGALLPGLSDASDPAFRTSTPLTAPQSVTVTGLDPDPAVPGEPVTVLGSGFDWIIPANNLVFWPGANGPVESAVTEVTETRLETVVPAIVAEGQIRVETGHSTGLLAFTPQFATLEILASTASGALVPGVALALRDADGALVAEALTDAEGRAVLAGLLPGDYEVELTAPEGYRLDGESVRGMVLTSQAETLLVTVVPLVKSITTVPELLEVEVGGTLDVTLVPLDFQGEVIEVLEEVRWLGGGIYHTATWEGLSGTLIGTAPGPGPGETPLSVQIDGDFFEIPVTVTSYVEGTVTQDPDPATAPAPTEAQSPVDGPQQAATTEPSVGTTVKVLSGTDVIATGTTDAQGRYHAGGLFAGSYDVTIDPTADRDPVPVSHAVTLGEESPTATADFHMSGVSVEWIGLKASDSGIIDALEGSVTLEITAYDANDEIVPHGEPTFWSGDEAIATVDANGVVTGHTNGQVYIYATVDGVQGFTIVTVSQKAVVITILDDKDLTPMPDEIRANVNDQGTLQWEAFDANGHPIKDRVPVFATSDAAVASVDASGLVNTLSVGTAALSVTMDGATDVLTLDVLDAHTGDLVIAEVSGPGVMTPAEVAAAKIGLVDGNLIIESTGLTDLTGLESLLEVTGSVWIRFNPSLANIEGIGGIGWIQGDLVVEGNPTLLTPTPAKPAQLEAVSGSVMIWNNPLITDLDLFAGLRHLGGDLDVDDNAALLDLDGLALLEFVPGVLYLRDNPALNSLSNLPALQEIGADLVVEAGAEILGIPSLSVVGGGIQVGGEGAYNNTVIQEIHLPALTCTGYGVGIFDNLALAVVEMPALERTEGTCTVSPPPAPAMRAVAREPVFTFRPEGEVTARPHLENLEAVRTRRYEAARSHGDAVRLRLRDESLQRLEAERSRRWQQRTEARAERAETVQRTVATLNAQAQARVTAAEGIPVAAQSVLRGQARASEAAKSAVRQASRQGEGEKQLARATITTLEPQPAVSTWAPVIVQHNPALTTLTLTSLRVVAAEILIANAAITSLSLPHLEDVGDDFSVNNNPVLTSLSSPSLVNVGGNLELYTNPVLTSPLFPALVDVGSMLYVGNQGAIGILSLPQLQHVGFYLNIFNNQGLTSISMPLLAQVLNDLYVYNNTGLTGLEIATGALLDVHSDFYVDANPDLENVHVPGLSHVYGMLVIMNNSGLVSVSMATEATLTVDDEVWVSGNDVPHAWTVTMPGLVSVANWLFIDGNTGLQSVTMASGDPATANEVFVYQNPDLQSVSFPSLQSVTGRLSVYTLPGLQQLSAPSLQQVGWSLYLDGLGTAGTPVVFAFDALQSVAYTLLLQNSPGAESFSLPALTWIGDGATVWKNANLETLSWPALTHMTTPPAPAPAPPMAAAPALSTASDLILDSNGSLSSVDVSSLEEVGLIQVINNGLVSFPTVGSLSPGTEVYVQNNAALTNMNGLAGVTDLHTIRFQSNPLLTDYTGLADLTNVVYFQMWSGGGAGTLTLPGLTRAWWNFEIISSGLTGISAPNLAHVGDGNGPQSGPGNLYLNNNPSLATADLTGLTTLDGSLQVTSTALTSLDVAITSPVYMVQILFNSVLTSVAGLAGIGTTDANPAVASTFMISANGSLCNEHVYTDVVDVIAARSASAFTSTPSVGNKSCSAQEQED